jgi:hypothetical protein
MGWTVLIHSTNEDGLVSARIAKQTGGLDYIMYLS